MLEHDLDASLAAQQHPGGHINTIMTLSAESHAVKSAPRRVRAAREYPQLSECGRSHHTWTRPAYALHASRALLEIVSRGHIVSSPPLELRASSTPGRLAAWPRPVHSITNCGENPTMHVHMLKNQRAYQSVPIACVLVDQARVTYITKDGYHKSACDAIHRQRRAVSKATRTHVRHPKSF